MHLIEYTQSQKQHLRPLSAKRLSLYFRLALKTLSLWRKRQIQRLHLAQLDDHMLKDIGISRYDAQVEANKKFWQE